ncbi:MAG: hypothetical protein LBJ87_00015 [bacterium]|nr:hypothetical protein [bacterium]
MCSEHQPHPSPRTAWRIFRDSDLPLPTRLRVAAANELWKVRHRQTCCGHYGQPGC